MIEDVWMHFAGFLGLVFFCCFLLFFFTFLCYLAVHVKCTVYHFSDCITQGYCSAELCWPTQRHWTYELVSVGRTKAAGQKDFDWSALTESFDLSTVWFGISSSSLIAVVKTDMELQTPPFTSSWTRQKIYRFIYTYTYACVCVCICVYMHI